MNKGHTKEIRSKSLLPLQQVLHQRLIKADTRIYRHVVDIGFGAFAPVKVLEFRNCLDVVGADAFGVHRELRLFLDVLEFDNAIEREVDFRLVEDVKENNLVAAMPQVVKTL